MAELPRLPESKIVFISGPVSSGKTHLMRQWAMMKERVLIHDAAADYLTNDFEHIWSKPDSQAVRILAERLKDNPHYFRIAYHINADTRQEDFFYQYACIWMVQKPRWFFIEECHEVAGIAMAPGMENLIRYARHNVLGVVAASQRVADVSPLLRSNARMVVLFHTTEFRDLIAIRERWGSEMEEAVKNLRPCIYNDDTKECEQHPECVVWLKGYGFRVVSLGSKIKHNKEMESDEQWQEILQEAPSTPEQQSSPQDSGEREQESPDDTSEPTPQ
jgi:hypothetical protein